MNFKSQLGLMLIVLTIFGCNSNENLPTVQNVELEMYAGTWHEIWRLPNTFEKGLQCVTATYSLLEDGKIEVVNKGVKGEKKKSITGKAWVPNSEYPGRLKVRFFWPFAGNYYIIDLADDYSYALVGDPSRKFLWILGRADNLPTSVIEQLKIKADSLGFNTSAMVEINHDCE